MCLPFSASEVPRFMAVVVFPTPPFWFATQITLPLIVFGEFPVNDFKKIS
jgi:hypothetical protein